MTWHRSWIAALLLVLSVGDGDTLTVLDGGHKRVVRLACI